MDNNLPIEDIEVQFLNLLSKNPLNTKLMNQIPLNMDVAEGPFIAECFDEG